MEALREGFCRNMAQEKRSAWLELVGLEEALQRHCGEAQTSWRDFAVSCPDFVGYVGERTRLEASLENLRSLHWKDLYLACACALGDDSAIRAFDAHCEGECERGLAKLAMSASAVDELRQGLRDHLFVADVSGGERIRRYSGKGPIRAWYRVSALRLAIDRLRAERRFVPVAEVADLDDHIPQVDPELEFLKDKYRQHFRGCFQDALRDLSSEQRNLLRYQLLDGLTLEQIGAIYGVHLTSIARRLQKTREVLLECTRRHLQHRLGVDEGELDSIMRLIRSRLDVSISRILES